MSGWTAAAVLVTGANGFLGRHLVERLVREGSCVTALVRPGTRPSFSGPVSYLESPLERLTPDLLSQRQLGTMDYVFHLGAFTATAGGQGNDVARVFDANLTGTRNLLESLAAVRTRLVVASTLDVYAPSPRPIRETSPVDPPNLYAASKLFCESLARVHALRHGWPLSILRYSNLYGPGEEHYRKLIPATIARLLAGDPPVLTGSCLAQRDYLYVSDAVEATLRACSPAVATPTCINVVRGRSVAVGEVLGLLMELSRYVGPGIEQNPSPQPSRDFKFDNQLMRKSLGTWPFVPLRRGLAAEIRQARQHT